jgi:GGDEF domain-containing protein
MPHFVFAVLSNALMQGILRLSLLIALVLSNGIASAQWASPPAAGIEIAGIDVLHNVAPQLTLAQVLSGEAGIFVKHNGLQVQHSEWGRAFWLRIQLKRSSILPTEPAQDLLVISKSYVDTVRLFTPSDTASLSWQTQVHGDSLPPDQWTHETLYPQFTLPQAASIATFPDQRITVYMQVDHSAPLMISPQLISANKVLRDNLVSYTFYGMLFGAIVLAVILAAVQGWLYRDAIYVWYSAYAASVLMACMSYSGLAQQMLWRIGGKWPGTAVLSFVLLCCAFQLQFARCIRNTSQQPLWQIWSGHLLAISCVMLAICFPLVGAYWRIFYYMSLSLIALTMIFITTMIIQSWQAGSQLAKAWLWASCPLWLTGILALLETVGVIPTMPWAFNMVIFATAIEVLFIGLGLQWFVRERHGLQERSKALAATDPLTGFATAQAFQTLLLRDWNSRDTQKQGMAVIYIELQTKAQDRKHLEQLLTRSVRVLRSATHPHDVVARLDGQLMAILMPHVQMGDDLSQRLSRMVALGLMPDRGGQNVSILQFRIAATTRAHYQQPVAQLDSDLRALLAKPTGWGSKPIRYLSSQERPSARKIALALDDSKMQELWEKALARELQDRRL